MGLAAYLAKPITQPELFEAVSAALRLGADSTSSAHTQSPSAPATYNRQLQVLLAEDNLVNQRLSVLLLEKRGHSVTTVGDGQKALAAMEEKEFDIVLMDVQMPQLDGLQATRAIREREKKSGKHVPIIVMTAHALKGDREVCLSAGVDDYISEPIHASELFELIDRILGITSQRQAVQPAVAPYDSPFDEAAVLARVNGDVRIFAELVTTFLGNIRS